MGSITSITMTFCRLAPILAMIMAKGYPSPREMAVARAPSQMERRNTLEYWPTLKMFSMVKRPALSVKAKYPTSSMGTTIKTVIQTV